MVREYLCPVIHAYMYAHCKDKQTMQKHNAIATHRMGGRGIIKIPVSKIIH